MTEHTAFLMACAVIALLIIGWWGERHRRRSADYTADMAEARANEAWDLWNEERRKHPKRGEGGRFTKRSTFGTDRPVG